MRRAVLSFLVAAATFAVCAVLAAREAAAVSMAQVVGVYRLNKMKGDGWLRGASSPYRVERIAGQALLILARNTPDDGKLHVEIRLDPALAGSVIADATASPAFVGQGVLVGDSMAVVDAGTPGYVNAITVLFQKGGAKVLGHWLSARPATDPSAGAASGFDVAFTGKQLKGPRERLGTR